MPESSERDAQRRRGALGGAIRRARGQRSQEVLADLLDVSQATISSWEWGHVDLTCEQVRTIELQLHLRAGELLRAGGYLGTEAPLDQDEPICRLWVFNVDEATQLVKSAFRLGLGVELRNDRVLGAVDDTEEERWIIAIRQAVPRSYT